jgi:hypothetical protein
VYGRSRITGNYYPPTRLLFPITKKNYNGDEFTKLQWECLKDFLAAKSTLRTTIFGYGAPQSDVEAVKLLNEAWGTPEDRNMEQFEIIDIRPEEEVKNQWETFIHTHHYNYGTSFFDSVLAHFPRRTSESWWWHYMANSPEESFVKSTPIPQNFKTQQEMWDWFQPFIDKEEEAKEIWKKEEEAKSGSAE